MTILVDHKCIFSVQNSFVKLTYNALPQGDEYIYVYIMYNIFILQNYNFNINIFFFFYSTLWMVL